jgi:hypothetical protein
VHRLSVVGDWGSTAEDRAASYPCDGLVERPDIVVFRAVDVAAPAPLVFRWLCQLRAAPYSYDWIDNFGRKSPQMLTPGLDELEVGQPFMTIFRLVAFDSGSTITLDSSTPFFGRVVGTYRVVPTVIGQSHLVAKLLVVAPRGPLGPIVRHLLPVGDLVMMRKQLLTLKLLAERTARTPTP